MNHERSVSELGRLFYSSSKGAEIPNPLSSPLCSVFVLFGGGCAGIFGTLGRAVSCEREREEPMREGSVNSHRNMTTVAKGLPNLGRMPFFRELG